MLRRSKKVLALLMFCICLMFALCSCGSKEEKAIAALNDNGEMRAIRYISENQWLGAEYDEYWRDHMVYVRDVKPGDLGEGAFPKELYTYPLNCCGTIAEDPTKDYFMTNGELLAALGEGQYEQLVASARGYLQSFYDFDYRNGYEYNEARYKYFLDPYVKTQEYVETTMLVPNMDAELIMHAQFVTDPSLIYYGADNGYRIRGRLYTWFEEEKGGFFDGTVTYSMKIPFKIYYSDCEVTLRYCDDAGRTPQWEHNKYTFYNRFSFAMFIPATDADIRQMYELFEKDETIDIENFYLPTTMHATFQAQP